MKPSDSAPPDLISIPLPGFEQQGVEQTDERTDVPTETSAVHDLALAIASSGWWHGMSPAQIIVRHEPTPMLGVLGHFDDVDRLRLGLIHQQIRDVLPETRHVTYEQAEAACEVLAEKLVSSFGRERLAEFHFEAIPRGGLIVLGMLSYLLDLDQQQLADSDGDDRPLVIVDDCVLSGHRLKRFLGQQAHSDIIVACLYSTPQVRQAILEREPSVTACLSAHDLRDHAEQHLGSEYPAWRERWADRESDTTYWTGQPEHVCFPWNEPDVTFWNEITEREERGWPLVPPERCLKHRGRLQADSVQIQVQPSSRGTLRVTDGVLYGSYANRLVVGDTASQQLAVLNDVAADMWRAILRHGDADAAVAALAEVYEVPGDTLRVDLRGFIAAMQNRGLLEDVEASP